MAEYYVNDLIMFSLHLIVMYCIHFEPCGENIKFNRFIEIIRSNAGPFLSPSPLEKLKNAML
jgi:hypothetical protein